MWTENILKTEPFEKEFARALCSHNDQARVVERMDNAIHQIIYYPADSVVCFVNTHPLDSDLSGG